MSRPASPQPTGTPSAAHHLLIPFAACSAPEWLPTLQALPSGRLQNLGRLLQGMKPLAGDTGARGDAHTLSPPHERALAQALGLVGHGSAPDGLIPWAARDAAAQLGARSDTAWAWITPCHWAMGREHATLTDPAALELREDESRALIAAMQPYFATDGITLHYLRPDRWLAQGALFRHLPTASLDRVLGRNVDPWLPTSRGSEAHAAASVEAQFSAGPPQGKFTPSGGSEAHAVASVGARMLRRLQNEMQMLLYTHPVNDRRAERRQLPVNSFWISGTGTLTDAAASAPADTSPAVSMPRSLADAVFRDDWSGYAEAWATLDAHEFASLLARQRAGETVRLTLCGELNAHTYESSRPGLLDRISGLLNPPSVLGRLTQL